MEYKNGGTMIKRNVINKISHERELKHKYISINGKKLKQFLLTWFFGGFLAFLPCGISFLKLPVSQLSFYRFFNSSEIIYISITMSIIVFCDGAEKKTFLGFWMNLIIIVIGVALYSSIDQFPIFSIENNLPILNIVLLATVVFIGVITYINVCTKEEIS